MIMDWLVILQLLSILYIKMSVNTILLEMSLHVCSQFHLITMWTSCIPLLSQMIMPDVSLAIGLV